MLLSGLLASAAGAACSGDDGKRLLWGDLHVHTSYSLDAYLLGVRRTPQDAFAFARGAPERLPDGSEIRLERPLDFVAVTDHGEYLAATTLCGSGEPSAYCDAIHNLDGASFRGAFRTLFADHLGRAEPICPADAERCARAAADTWQRLQDAANQADEPCRFTALIGSEWSATPDDLHWHRNLIYRTEKVPHSPPNVVDQPTQEQLWRTLDATCRRADGCEVLAIPHNTNLGMGGTFRIDGHDAGTLALRRRYERLAEVVQHKGQSECFPGSPLADDECAFEVALPVPVLRRQATAPGPPSEAENQTVSSGYLRDALGEGLAVGARTGINPFRYGLIGSTDTHAARPGYVEESDWQGTFGRFDATPEARLALRHYNPGGLTAVWATENTRDGVFRALARREAYGTSGPRIALRFLQSFDGAVDLCASQPSQGPAREQITVMGGTLTPDAERKPRFAVHAAMDQRPLARLELIKLTYRDGAVVQQIRSVSAAGSEGRAQWCSEWRDDDYQPREPALWYARVLEVPGPRWSMADGGAEQMIRERAWSSPIWALPQFNESEVNQPEE